MAIEIIVEDGSIVEGAYSYNSVAEFREHARVRAQTIPVSDDECATLLIKAMDYLQTLLYIGSLVEEDQPVLWPRYGAYVEGYMLDPDEIPWQIRSSQNILGVTAQTVDLMPVKSTTSKGKVASESVAGVVSRSYFPDTANTNILPIIPEVVALLRPLLRTPNVYVIRA